MSELLPQTLLPNTPQIRDLTGYLPPSQPCLPSSHSQARSLWRGAARGTGYRVGFGLNPSLSLSSCVTIHTSLYLQKPERLNRKDGAQGSKLPGRRLDQVASEQRPICGKHIRMLSNAHWPPPLRPRLAPSRPPSCSTGLSSPGGCRVAQIPVPPVAAVCLFLPTRSLTDIPHQGALRQSPTLFSK